MPVRLQLAPDPDGPSPSLSPIKVILADDHATVRRNLLTTLGRHLIGN